MGAHIRVSFIVTSLTATLSAPALAAGWAASTDFDSATDPQWGTVITPGSGGQMNNSGGNPGRYADARPVIPAGEPGTIGRAFTGYQPGATLFGSQVSFSHVVISADVRVGETSPHLTAQFVPMLVQDFSLFAPLQGFTLTQTAWGFTGVLLFTLAEFVHSTQTFDPLGQFRAGFAVKITGDAGLTPRTGRYDVDNVSIQLVPAPSIAGLSVAALAFASRRRRP